MTSSAETTAENGTRLSPRRRPAQAQSRETVKRIQRAAAWIVENEGLPKLNSNRIAAVAGVSIGTVYKFFPNKQAIMASVVAEWSEERERVRRDISELDPAARLSDQVEAWFRHMVETPASHVLTITRVQQFYPELQTLDQSYVSRAVDMIDGALRRDGCRLEPAARRRAAGRINTLGAYLLSQIHAASGAERDETMRWALSIMRAAIAEALGVPEAPSG
jgi:AcrR family transcriptional regulator